MTTGARRVHDFCWINLMTPEAAKARAFFARLFGWTYAEMPGVPGGELIEVDGRNAGALMDLAARPMMPAMPPHINVMVRVESADAAVEKANAIGGRAEPAFDVLENGRMAMITDPNGAQLGVWQPRKEVGIEADSRAHGAPSWFETLTTDAGRAAKFYAELFGWAPHVEQPVPGMSYTVFELGSVQIAGAMMACKEMGLGEVPPHWAVSFAVKNADETAALAVELGGAVLVPVAPIPKVGRFALLRSPQGVSFNIVEYAR